MVATDTVVGIVGAVVLVAVMAGVFVYEYNNAPEGEPTPEELQAHFEEDYAGLSATQDMDGDGIPNFEDHDIDDDGINNTEDAELSRTFEVSGTVPQATPAASPAYSMGFTVQNGSIHLEGSLTYSRTNGAIAAPALEARITGPGGFSVTASSTQSGNSVTLTFDVEEALAPGDYTLVVEHATPFGPAAPVSGDLTVHYETPALEDVHGH